ncbi:phosphotransferase family protein [Halomonas sp. M20]|uniref:phosphotransferase family protein n=1 Tax=Halomonas sp. M20 TaxID=2763264 RepID=UPI001D0B414C|nr:phosphotransferase [Halomonas sp. M20]
MTRSDSPIACGIDSRLANLHRALQAAGLDVSELGQMADTGLAHEHVWLYRRNGADWVARVPKQSQMRLAPQANLDYQACCFARASQGGHTPALHAVLPPSDALPRGGLVVSAIDGRTAQLPRDLPAIARALASLHRLSLPHPAARTPLLAPHSPWPALIEEIRDQASYLAQADISADTHSQIFEEFEHLEAWLAESQPSSTALISFDAHPGNFLIQDDGHAVLVDLEKCRYGLPGLDLAHATLYTSTTWDIATHAELSVEEVHGFYRHWATAMGDDDRHRDQDTMLQCRRAMWLWSVTWCAKWRVENHHSHDATAGGEDWSTELSDPALIAHVRDRVNHYLSPRIVARVCTELQYLQRLDLFG